MALLNNTLSFFNCSAYGPIAVEMLVFLATAYVKFSLSGGLLMHTTLLIPKVDHMIYFVLIVAVAVRAMTCTCLFIRFRMSPSLLKDFLKSSPLHICKQKHKLLISIYNYIFYHFVYRSCFHCASIMHG